MIYLLSNHAQGTPEWKADRAGKLTGSRASDMQAKIKTGEAAARRDYRIQLVTERLSGAPADDGFVSKEMLWGTEQEPYARMAYEQATGRIVNEAGFAYLSDVEAGCSVDGFVDDGAKVGIFEAKCPKSATHITYLLAKRLPPAYAPQVTHNLWITGASFCDFVSFDPRLPAHLQLFTVRIERDEAAINAYICEAMSFLSEVDATVAQLELKAA